MSVGTRRNRHLDMGGVVNRFKFSRYTLFVLCVQFAEDKESKDDGIFFSKSGGGGEFVK